VSERVAIVTGAGRGIGRATALALATAGMRVMAVARSEEQLRSLSAEAPVEHLAASVADEAGCAAIVEETRRRLGPVSVLVNNAGVGSYHERPIWEQPTELWRDTMSVNLDAPFHLTRLCVPDMMAAGWGRIVMVSSTAGQLGAARCSAYCASKHGVIGLARAVAQDVAAHGITCNAVLPGWVRTAMSEAHAQADADRRGITAEEIWAEYAASYPAGRVVEAEEIAGTIAFLASDAASGVNAEAITVAGGSPW
jgi:NAD(P)-dependent dehydrogenase (short-subunit alcohol dehydrogenase family)